jgi:AraC-like DNA-binding protein
MAVQCNSLCEWREQHARQSAAIDFRPLSDAPFYASVVPIFHDLRMVQGAYSPGVTFRDEELCRDGDDSFAFMISNTTNLEIEQQGHNLQLRRGDATVFRAWETGTVGSRRHFGYVAILIPHQEIGARFDVAPMRRMPWQSEALQLLRAYAQTLKKGKLGHSPEARATIRRHIIDLAVLAATSPHAIGESGLSAVAAARRATALDHITSSFEDPELSLETVARDLRISPRYLQRLLEMSGTSFTARVNELRLQRAFTLLTEARDGERRISEIALQVGFSDISHFNRLFRSRFGDTPRGVRGQRRQ